MQGNDWIGSAHRAAGAVTLVLLLLITGLASENDPVRGLRAEIQAAHERLKNYRCSVEFVDWRDQAARQRLWDDAVKTPGTPKELIAHYREDLHGTGRKYESQEVVADSAGRIKIVHTHGTYGPDGDRRPDEQMSCAWDGTTSVRYSRRLDTDGPGSAILTASRLAHFQIARNPLWSFGGRFLAALDKAMEAGERIDMQQTAPGLLQVCFVSEDPVTPDGSRWAWFGTIDVTRGFSVPEWGFTHATAGRGRFSATFAELDDGVWFPAEGKVEGFFADGVPDCSTVVRVSNAVANDPNFSTSQFHIDLPEGTQVQDTIAGVAFIVGDPASMRLLGDYTNTGHVVAEAARDRARQGNTVLIPHMKQAIESNEPFVLDLRTGRLLGVDEPSASQDVLALLHGAGVGDLFWDGDIVAIGDAKLEPAGKREEHRLTLTTLENASRYTLAQDLPLPCLLRVTDRTGKRYSMLLKHIGAEGISVTYKSVPGPNR